MNSGRTAFITCNHSVTSCCCHCHPPYYCSSSNMLRQCGRSLARAPLRALSRGYSVVIEAESEAEKTIAAQIQQGLKAESIKVADISGGCGSMYAVEVVSGEFKGLSVVKQHQLVTRLLKDKIAEWHGFQLVTKPAAQ